MSLTKNQIIEAIHERLKFNDKDLHECTQLLESLIEIIKKSLESGEDVLVSGFGKFCVNEKKERKGRNPSTGEDLILPTRKVVVFKCSGKLRDRVNEKKKCAKKS